MKTALLACVSLVLLAAVFARVHERRYPACTSVASGEEMLRGPCHRKRFITDTETGTRYCCEESGKLPVQMQVWVDAERDYKYQCKCLNRREKFCYENPHSRRC